MDEECQHCDCKDDADGVCNGSVVSCLLYTSVQDGTGQQVVLGVQQPQHEGGTQQADERILALCGR